MNRIVPFALAVVLGAGLSACAKHDAASSDTSSSAASSSGASSSASSSGASSSSAGEADTSGAQATTAPDAASATSAPDGTPTSSPNVSVSAGTVTVTQGKNTFSVGAVGASDLGGFGVPVYPKATPQDGTSLDATENGVHTKMVVLTSTDSFDDVDAWYKSQLGSYQASHISMGDAKTSTYKTGEETALPYKTVLLTTHKDSNGVTGTSITVLVKEKS